MARGEAVKDVSILNGFMDLRLFRMFSQTFEGQYLF